MLSSIEIHWKDIIVLYAQPSTLHSFAPEHKVNGGPGQPNWYKAEYKRAKQENREADYRWGPMVTHVDVDGPESTSQHPSEAPQPQCAAAAMMHGMSGTS